MKWISKIFNFYLNSSIHVSLAVVALQCITYITLDIKWDKNLFFFTFFATITGYNFIKYSRLAKWHHLSLTESLRAIQIFSFVCFMALLYYFTKMTTQVIIACSVLGLLTLLYALPVFSRKRTLRSMQGVKIYIIALVWAGVAVVLPVLQASLDLSWDSRIMLLQRFLFVLVITLPFDIRDLKYDDAAIGTIPLKIGVQNTKILGVLLLVALLLLEALKDEITSEIMLSTLVISIFSGLLLLLGKEKQSKYYASFLVESLPIVWFVLLSAISIY
jgi:hypothetical protein